MSFITKLICEILVTKYLYHTFSKYAFDFKWTPPLGAFIILQLHKI